MRTFSPLAYQTVISAVKMSTWKWRWYNNYMTCILIYMPTGLSRYHGIMWPILWWTNTQKKGTEMAPLGHHFGSGSLLQQELRSSDSSAIGNQGVFSSIIMFSSTKMGPLKDLFYGRSNGAPREPFWCHLFFWVNVVCHMCAWHVRRACRTI